MDTANILLYRYAKAANLSLFTAPKSKIKSLFQKIENDYSKGLINPKDYQTISSTIKPRLA